MRQSIWWVTLGLLVTTSFGVHALMFVAASRAETPPADPVTPTWTVSLDPSEPILVVRDEAGGPLMGAIVVVTSETGRGRARAVGDGRYAVPPAARQASSWHVSVAKAGLATEQTVEATP